MLGKGDQIKTELVLTAALFLQHFPICIDADVRRSAGATQSTTGDGMPMEGPGGVDPGRRQGRKGKR